MAYQAGTGMAGFDEQDAQDAADALAKMNQAPAPDAPATQPPPFVPGGPAPDVSQPPSVDVPAPAPPDASLPPIAAPPAPAEPAKPTDAAATAETPAETGAKAADELGPPPGRPHYTGDPTKDVQLNLQWQRQLTDYSTNLARKQGEIAKGDASIAASKAAREAEAERSAQAQRQAELDAYQQQRQIRQQQIDDAVKEKSAALTDLKHGGERSWGDIIASSVAIALGAIGQGLQLKGGVKGAQNEGLNAVNKRIADDEQRRKDRLKAASDAVLEARYGFKDAADNHRAGLNDIATETAAKYRLIASEAEEQLRAGGASDQDVKTNAVVVDALQKAAQAEGAIHEREESTQVAREKAAAENKLASAHLDLGERTLKATEAQRRDVSYEHRREFDLKDQEARDRAADRKAADAEKATVGSVRQNAVLGNIAEAEKAVKDLGEVPIESIQKLQTNTEQAKAGEHSATGSVTGNLLTRAARATGLAARGQYDDIPEGDQKKITAAKQVITHLTEMQQGKNLETLEQYEQRYSPYVPGLSVEEVRRREKALPGLVAEQRAIQDPNGVGTKRQAKAAPQTDAEQAREHLDAPKPSADMVTIRNAKTGETKRVTRAEAQALGAL